MAPGATPAPAGAAVIVPALQRQTERQHCGWAVLDLLSLGCRSDTGNPAGGFAGDRCGSCDRAADDPACRSPTRHLRCGIPESFRDTHSRIFTRSACSGTMGGCLPRDYVLLGGRTREAKPGAGTSARIAELQRDTQEKSLNHGCQDQAHPAWQDPQSPVPHRRRRLAHPPRRPLDRGHRPLPPEGRAQPHRDRLGAGPVLARRRRPAHRTGAQAAEDHRRLAEVQGSARHRGHPEGQGAQAEQTGVVQRGAGRCRGRSGRRGHHSQEEEGPCEEGGRGGQRRG